MSLTSELCLPALPTTLPATGTLAVAAAGTELDKEARQLAQRLGLSLVLPTSTDFPLLIVVSAAGYALQMTGRGAPGPVRVDFTAPALTHRRKHGGDRRQGIGRALGLKGGHAPFVVDATAGLGRDAFIMAHLGCRVLLVEQSAVLNLLLETGLQQAALDPGLAATISRMALAPGNSLQILKKIAEGRLQPEIVYLDPMFPLREKSALVKKEMQVLKVLVGDDQNSTPLLAAALACATRRVVVKRPRLAPALATERAPSFAVTGRSSRFDVYLVPS